MGNKKVLGLALALVVMFAGSAAYAGNSIYWGVANDTYGDWNQNSSWAFNTYPGYSPTWDGTDAVNIDGSTTYIPSGGGFADAYVNVSTSHAVGSIAITSSTAGPSDVRFSDMTGPTTGTTITLNGYFSEMLANGSTGSRTVTVNGAGSGTGYGVTLAVGTVSDNEFDVQLYGTTMKFVGANAFTCPSADTVKFWDNGTFYLTGGQTTSNTWNLYNGTLIFGGGCTNSGALTGPMYPNGAWLQFGGASDANSNLITQSGAVDINYGTQTSLYFSCGGASSALVSGQIVGGAGNALVRAGTDTNTVTFSPATTVNSGFAGSMTFKTGMNVFQDTWSNLGNINLLWNNSTGSMSGCLGGNGTVGMASGKGLTASGAGTTLASYAVVAPTGGTLTIGTTANSNAVHFGNQSALTINLQDATAPLTAHGHTGADSLAVVGNVDLGVGGATPTVNVLNLVFGNPLLQYSNFTLMSYTSISSVQKTFGQVDLNGVALATADGNGTGLHTIDANHHLVYGATSLQLVQDTWMPGDINGDGLVDVADYDIWAANVGATNATWQQGDLNGDHLVDVADYDIWAANVGASATVTPEPISMIILAIGGGLAALKRRPSGASLRVRHG